MKEVGLTFAALQQNMDARDGAQVISDAAGALPKGNPTTRTA